MTYSVTPTIYAPIVGDNGPALKALIEAGERWIKINGPVCRIDTTVILTDGGLPADYLMIEPADDVDSVLIDISGVGRDPVTPSNPTYAGFDYGSRTTAGYLTVAAAQGDITLTVNNGALYTVGDWINVSNASTNPGVTLQPIDGAGGHYQIVSKAGNVLTLDQRTERAHPLNATASKCVPIIGLSIRGLTFTGDAAVGFHVHDGHNCMFQDINTDSEWTGRVGLLIDNWGRDNVVQDCFTRGTTPGTGLGETAWAIAFEGQNGTKGYDCGGTGAGAGVAINYCVDTVLIEPLAYSNNVNISILTESIRCKVIRPYTATPAVLDTTIGGDCVDCEIVDRREATSGMINGPGSDSQIEWRSIPVGTDFSAEETLLAVDENGGMRQINPATALVTMVSDYAPRANFWIKTTDTGGGNFQAENANQKWIWGMLAAPGSRDWVLFNDTGGTIPITISYSTGDAAFSGNVGVASGKVYRVNSVQVVAARKTGWTPATGTATRTTFDTATVTLPQLAERVKAIIDDLHATAGHGLFGT